MRWNGTPDVVMLQEFLLWCGKSKKRVTIKGGIG